MGFLKNLAEKIANNYDIRDMNEEYNSYFKDIDNELKRNEPVAAFHKIEKLFSYKWLEKWPKKHLFEKDKRAEASFYAEACRLLDEKKEYHFAMKAFKKIPDSSPHKGLALLDRSPELVDFMQKSDDQEF
tara:strand:- start:231 stop:620 length:390 start_codon:yes stop_codon:yes gene_type:complete